MLAPFYIERRPEADSDKATVHLKQFNFVQDFLEPAMAMPLGWAMYAVA